MHVVIMGCGRVGSSLAATMGRLGHEITVVDQNPESFRRLGTAFQGRTVTGLGFDRTTLVQAGIEGADAFAAVSSGDNSNILSARVVRETFGVGNVVARIYDPGRAEVYERLGIPTVATVPWATDQIVRRLVPSDALVAYRDPSGTVGLVTVPVDVSWVGVRLSVVEARTGARVAFVTRFGRAELPGPDTVHQEGDQLNLLIPLGRGKDVIATLSRPPAEED